jgi:hypothetical protein
MGNPYNGFTSEDRTVSSKLFRARLKAGVYETPQKDHCEACFQSEGQIEWHREDYSIVDPSTLFTICYRCHRVLHMRDRYPETWDLYRKLIREGRQWYDTKSIGTVMKENVKAIVLRGSSVVNDPRPWTLLDAVDDGSMLNDTHEVRMVRMAQVWEDFGKTRPADVEPDDLTLF